MKKFIVTFALLLGIAGGIFAQNIKYQLVKIDSTYDKVSDSTLTRYMAVIDPIYTAKMDVVIGESAQDMTSHAPQSELSNLLTDWLYQRGNEYSLQMTGVPADLSVLNFGGIRNSLPKGPITIGRMFAIAAFDNTIVLVDVKGKELQKLFNKFSTSYNEPYANAKITYRDGKIESILVNGAPIDPERTYRIATIDFLAISMGDKIFSGIETGTPILTNIVLRDMYIEQVQNAKAPITSALDDRVIIK